MANNTDHLANLLDKIEAREMRVGVIGLGYVGLPLACEFAKAGLTVVGIDVSSQKVAAIAERHSYIADVPEAELAELVEAGRLTATTDFSVIADLDAVSICVPTPLRKSKDPNIQYVVEAADRVSQYAHPGLLVVLESTTYPGTTDELIVPRLTNRGLTVGQDVFVAFSPERVDPGNAVYTTRTTPKVIGGSTERCTAVAAALYGLAVNEVVKVASPSAAEMVKLLENTFRAVNIALVNEIALMCDRLDLDVWEIIDAAATKPFGYMRFTPGPGLGGHCIPIDPLYLAWKLREMDYEARFIALADSINSDMPRHVIGKVAEALNDDGKAIRGSNVLVLGVAYKPDVDDIRESPALTILGLLNKHGAKLSYADPYVPSVSTDGVHLTATELSADALSAADCVLVITNHKAVDWDMVGQHAPLIVDTRNALGGRAVTGRLVKL